MGSAIKEKYSLQWQDFHANIATSFGDLRDEEEFLDVTLTCDEDKQVMAHKVILSACSPYFKSMLVKQRSALNPVLIMPDTVRFEDILSILDFMYHGEVNIPHPGGFLAVAEDLKDNVGNGSVYIFYAILYTSFYFNKMILISEAFRSIKLSICLFRECAL